ncbi:SPOR domain-containing protein [Flavobacterium sp. I3-2]|uniref:SPOR domain-containing protein n=1 Tax=Flavobacterium sp. I3-2 TaxID=2748319 RepID=UPI0015B2B751|nr:SPOR domain-containing protein [Flavobacterium sp. I3-2]
MKNLRNQLPYFIIILTFLNVNNSNAQSSQFQLIQDNNFEKLVKEKNSVNNSFSIYKNFSIQLFHSDKTETENKFHEFKNNFPDIVATIIYAEPKYKLIVGNYRNKIDAERNLKKLQKNYPEAFIVRLTK